VNKNVTKINKKKLDKWPDKKKKRAKLRESTLRKKTKK